jgi:nucleoside-triphosphatase
MNKMSNILITGYPRTGKTTLIKKFLEQTTQSCTGFITEEIRNDKNIRVGFKVVGISSNQTGILAHVSVKSNYQVGKYKVDLLDFEKIALEEMKKKADLVIIDEIGKMELFSKLFKDQLINCLQQRNVLGTITMRGGGKFVMDIMDREDVELIEITQENRNQVLNDIITKLN